MIVNRNLERFPVRLRVWGEGEPLLVFPGGPGLSGSYFGDIFEPLSAHRQVIVFDPLGCGGSRLASADSVTADTTCEHATLLLRDVAGASPIDIIAHSWGSYLAAEALRRAGPGFARTLTLSNPVPGTRAGFNASGAALVSRVPAEKAALIGDLAAQNSYESGKAMMQEALPYYCGRNNHLPELDFEYYNDTYNAIVESMGEFDTSPLLRDIRERTLIVFGSTDHITPDLYFEFTNVASLEVEHEVIDGGHFAFADSPNAYISLLARRLGI